MRLSITLNRKVASKTWFDAEFFRIGEEASRRFGFTWLQINLVIQRALIEVGIEPCDSFTRWMCFVIARAVCLKLEQDGEQQKGES